MPAAGAKGIRTGSHRPFVDEERNLRLAQQSRRIPVAEPRDTGATGDHFGFQPVKKLLRTVQVRHGCSAEIEKGTISGPDKALSISAGNRLRPIRDDQDGA